jgi:hypothetical protein
MAQLNLTPEEQSIVVEALESFLSDLRMEIADTEKKTMREVLKNQEKVINKVLDALRPGK